MHNVSFQHPLHPSEITALNLISELSLYPSSQLNFSNSEILHQHLYDFSDQLEGMYTLFLSCEALLSTWIAFFMALVQSSIDDVSQLMVLAYHEKILGEEYAFEIETDIAQLEQLLNTLMQDFYHLESFSGLSKLRDCESRLQVLNTISRLSQVTQLTPLPFHTKCLDLMSKMMKKAETLDKECGHPFFSNSFSSLKALTHIQTIGTQKTQAIFSILNEIEHDQELGEKIKQAFSSSKNFLTDIELKKEKIKYEEVMTCLTKIQESCFLEELSLLIKQLRKMNTSLETPVKKQVKEMLSLLEKIQTQYTPFFKNFETFKMLFLKEMKKLNALGHNPIQTPV